jgi:maltooligosyltrehalose trehalohydrolase
MPFGASVLPGGGVRFRLWAPDARSVELVLSAQAGAASQARGLDLAPLEGGWFETLVPEARDGTRYAFRVDGATVVPDPASRSNPDDVHAASALVDPLAFDWPDDGWTGRPWTEAVVYELHVGTFTPEGSFDAVVDRLDDLVALGVTAIELMPVADFPGARGWGYDGVLPYAPESRYGSPDALKRLVAAAHARGLMVLLDVVYNHFGPDGNYLWVYAKPFFDTSVHTPWGAAIAFDGPAARTVRDFFIHNALYWIEEFHVDGLRIDAVHAMHDRSAPHFVDELAQAVHAGPGRTRHVHLVLENDHNEAAHLARAADGGAPLADAQWNDDVHHAVHVLATDETDGYYVDYGDDPVGRLGRALAEGFGYQGDPSRYRHGALRGTPSGHLPPHAFVNSLQTHDQVGNRAFGELLATLAQARGREDALRALVACVLLAPAIPMLFMGEEFAASAPFLYFCDYAGELAEAVTRGRRAEFSRFERFVDPAVRERIPDPNAESTFRRSVLDWSERSLMPHACWLTLYRELLEVRRSHLVAALGGAGSGVCQRLEPETLHLQWPLGGGRRWHLLARLGHTPGDAALLARLAAGECVYSSHGINGALPPWSVRAVVER